MANDVVYSCLFLGGKRKKSLCEDADMGVSMAWHGGERGQGGHESGKEGNGTRRNLVMVAQKNMVRHSNGTDGVCVGLGEQKKEEKGEEKKRVISLRLEK